MVFTFPGGDKLSNLTADPLFTKIYCGFSLIYTHPQ